MSLESAGDLSAIAIKLEQHIYTHKIYEDSSMPVKCDKKGGGQLVSSRQNEEATSLDLIQGL